LRKKMGKNKAKKRTAEMFSGRLLKKGQKKSLVQVGRELRKKDKTQKKKADTVKFLTTQSKTAKEKRLRKAARVMYKPDDHILLLGEGNFSFTAALVTLLAKHPAKKVTGHIVSTCFDDQKSLDTKYSTEATDNIKMAEDFGVYVLTGVDATDLMGHNKLQKTFKELFDADDTTHNNDIEEPEEINTKGFDKIVFNFPHTGCGEKDTDKNIQIHREFLKAYFTSALSLLRKEDSSTPIRLRPEIHVTLKMGEPYDSWKVSQIGSEANLQLKTSERFYPDMFPGYEHRRTIGTFDDDDKAAKGVSSDEFLKSGARTYIFVPKY